MKHWAWSIPVVALSGIAFGGPPKPPPPNQAGVNHKELKCDEVVPQALRDKYLPGMVLKQSGRVPLECNFEDPKVLGSMALLSIDCSKPKLPGDRLAAALEVLKKSGKDGKNIPGLGQGAAQVMFGGTEQIHVHDDKTPCKLVFGFGPQGPKTDHVEYARGVVAALTPPVVGM